VVRTPWTHEVMVVANESNRQALLEVQFPGFVNSSFSSLDHVPFNCVNDYITTNGTTGVNGTNKTNGTSVQVLQCNECRYVTPNVTSSCTANSANCTFTTNSGTDASNNSTLELELCTPLYIARNITTLTITSSNYSCSGHGACNSNNGRCYCRDGWYSSDCYLHDCPVSKIGTYDCGPGGTCNMNRGVCECVLPYFGATCQFKLCPSNCSGHGSCDLDTGTCSCDIPWSHRRCDFNTYFTKPVARVKHADTEYDLYSYNLSWFNVSRWTLYNLEANAWIFDASESSQFTLALMKERDPDPLIYYKQIPYPSDHVFYRTLSVCPFDLRLKDPRQVYTFGVKAPPNSRYELQFNHVEARIPVGEEFVIETYGRRYLYFERLVEHQHNYSYMWIDLKVEQGNFSKIAVMYANCPDASKVTLRESQWSSGASSYTVWGPQGTKCPCNANKTQYGENKTDQSCAYQQPQNQSITIHRTVSDSLLDQSDADSKHPCEHDAASTYRLEIFDCSSDIGQYVVMIETSGQHFKGTGFAQVFNDDHRCNTIVPPMREEILVTFGQVVEITFPIMVSTIVLMVLFVLVATKCYQQAIVNRQHRDRLDAEMFAKMNPTEYFGEEDEDENMKHATKFARHAKSAFQTRREREIRLEAALVNAQVMAEGYNTGETQETF